MEEELVVLEEGVEAGIVQSCCSSNTARSTKFFYRLKRLFLHTTCHLKATIKRHCCDIRFTFSWLQFCYLT